MRPTVPKATAFVDGALVDGSGAVRVHRHPADGEVFAEQALGGPADVDAAVAAARAAFPAWRDLAAGARRDLLFGAAQAIRGNADELAALVTLEMGMPIRASRAGVVQAAEWFAHYAGWADKIYGATAPVGPGVHDYVSYSPRGVVGAIIPWNGPVVALALKVAPALAAGNCVVLKPAEQAPFSSVALARLLDLPPGVLGVVGGGADTGARLVERADMISFTGGNAAGAAVAATAAARGIPAVLELGGKSASVVFADADPVRVGKLAALLGCIQNSGQGCFLPTRLLVQRGSYEAVLDAVVATVAKARIGDPFDPATTMGPVVDVAAAERIEGVIRGADARLVAGGGRTGAFVRPTVFADVDPASPLAQDEVFGPVLAVTPFDGEGSDAEEEAVALANGTRYGLAGYVWTTDLARAHRVADRLDAGYVSVNGMAGLPPAAPFGGWKASGQGVEGGLGGMREFLRTKNVHVQL